MIFTLQDGRLIQTNSIEIDAIVTWVINDTVIADGWYQISGGDWFRITSGQVVIVQANAPTIVTADELLGGQLIAYTALETGGTIWEIDSPLPIAYGDPITRTPGVGLLYLDDYSYSLLPDGAYFLDDRSYIEVTSGVITTYSEPGVETTPANTTYYNFYRSGAASLPPLKDVEKPIREWTKEEWSVYQEEIKDFKIFSRYLDGTLYSVQHGTEDIYDSNIPQSMKKWGWTTASYNIADNKEEWDKVWLNTKKYWFSPQKAIDNGQRNFDNIAVVSNENLDITKRYRNLTIDGYSVQEGQIVLINSQRYGATLSNTLNAEEQYSHGYELDVEGSETSTYTLWKNTNGLYRYENEYLTPISWGTTASNVYNKGVLSQYGDNKGQYYLERKSDGNFPIQGEVNKWDKEPGLIVRNLFRYNNAGTINWEDVVLHPNKDWAIFVGDYGYIKIVNRTTLKGYLLFTNEGQRLNTIDRTTNKFFFGGRYGNLYTIDDKWNIERVNIGTMKDINDIKFFKNVGFLVGDKGLIRWTNNSGKKWNRIILDTLNDYDFNSIAFININNIIITGQRGIWLELTWDGKWNVKQYTIEEKLSWDSDQIFIKENLTSVSVIDYNRSYLSGSGVSIKSQSNLGTDFQNDNNWTVVVRAIFNSLSGTQTIFQIGETSGSGKLITMQSLNGTLRLLSNSGSFTSTYTFNTNTEYLIGLSLNGSTYSDLTIFINDEEIDVEWSISETFNLPASKISLASTLISDKFLNGFVREAYMFNSYLTSENWIELYNYGEIVNPENHSRYYRLQHYWRNTSSTSWADRINNNAMVVTGATTKSDAKKVAIATGDNGTIIIKNINSPIVNDWTIVETSLTNDLKGHLYRDGIYIYDADGGIWYGDIDFYSIEFNYDTDHNQWRVTPFAYDEDVKINSSAVDGQYVWLAGDGGGTYKHLLDSFSPVSDINEDIVGETILDDSRLAILDAQMANKLQWFDSDLNYKFPATSVFSLSNTLELSSPIGEDTWSDWYRDTLKEYPMAGLYSLSSDEPTIRFNMTFTQGSFQFSETFDYDPDTDSQLATDSPQYEPLKKISQWDKYLVLKMNPNPVTLGDIIQLTASGLNVQTMVSGIVEVSGNTLAYCKVGFMNSGDWARFNGVSITVKNLNKWLLPINLETNFNLHPISKGYKLTYQQSSDNFLLEGRLTRKSAYYSLATDISVDLSSPPLLLDYTDNELEFGYGPKYNLGDYLVNIDTWRPLMDETVQYNILTFSSTSYPITITADVKPNNESGSTLWQFGSTVSYWEVGLSEDNYLQIKPSGVITPSVTSLWLKNGINYKVGWSSYGPTLDEQYLFKDEQYWIGSGTVSYNIDTSTNLTLGRGDSGVWNGFMSNIAVWYSTFSINDWNELNDRPYPLEHTKTPTYWWEGRNDVNWVNEVGTTATLNISGWDTITSDYEIESLPSWTSSTGFNVESNKITLSATFSTIWEQFIVDTFLDVTVDATLFSQRRIIGKSIDDLGQYVLELDNTVDMGGNSYTTINVDTRKKLSQIGDDLNELNNIETNDRAGIITSWSNKKNFTKHRFNTENYAKALTSDPVIRDGLTGMLYHDSNGYLLANIFTLNDANLQLKPIDYFQLGANLEPARANLLESEDWVKDGDEVNISLTNKSSFKLVDGLTWKSLTEKYQWFLEAEVQDAVIGEDSSGLVWYSGTWYGGRWYGSKWYSGIWFTGEWYSGEWYSWYWDKQNQRIVKVNNDNRNSQWLGGNWHSGTWYNGVHWDGSWKDGVWNNGLWIGGQWQNGTWNNGLWRGGDWINGLWKDGVWDSQYYYSTWFDGVWENGVFGNGRWVTGIWKKGVWGKLATESIRAVWEGGTWANGEWNSGDNTSNKFSLWKTGTWLGGIWNGGTMYNCDWRRGVWNNGVMQEIEIISIDWVELKLTVNYPFYWSVNQNITLLTEDYEAYDFVAQSSEYDQGLGVTYLTLVDDGSIGSPPPDWKWIVSKAQKMEWYWGTWINGWLYSGKWYGGMWANGICESEVWMRKLD